MKSVKEIAESDSREVYVKLTKLPHQLEEDTKSPRLKLCVKFRPRKRSPNLDRVEPGTVLSWMPHWETATGFAVKLLSIAVMTEGYNYGPERVNKELLIPLVNGINQWLKDEKLVIKPKRPASESE